MRDVEDFVDIVHMADNDTVAKGKNEPEMSYNIDRGDQASAQASYYAVVNGAQSGIFTSLEQARTAVPMMRISRHAECFQILKQQHSIYPIKVCVLRKSVAMKYAQN